MELLNPLGLTSAQFVELAGGRVVLDRVGGERGALDAYRRVFRDGVREIEAGRSRVAVRLPEIVRTLREESPEGEVVKFVARMESGAPTSAGSEAPPPPPQARRGSAETESAKTGGDRRATKEVHARDLAFHDVESVLIPMVNSNAERSYTLCVSSQVGCAMGCTFCETAQMGLVRSLTAEEIVAQWYLARHVVGFHVKNIVFMGMGEPLDNYDNVVQAIDVLRDHNGAHIPISQITVSTVGRVDGIRKLAEKIKEPGWHRLGIALSLNAPNDAVRGEIMPINRKWDMAAVQRELIDWPRFAGNKICVEYVLIPGVNDRPEHVDEIAAFVKPFELEKGKPRAMLNLIPYNPRRNSPWPAPREEDVEAFLAALHARGVFAKRRRTKGRAMMGACGQLGTPEIRGRRLVQATVTKA